MVITRNSPMLTKFVVALEPTPTPTLVTCFEENWLDRSTSVGVDPKIAPSERDVDVVELLEDEEAYDFQAHETASTKDAIDLKKKCHSRSSIPTVLKWIIDHHASRKGKGLCLAIARPHNRFEVLVEVHAHQKHRSKAADGQDVPNLNSSQ